MSDSDKDVLLQFVEACTSPDDTKYMSLSMNSALKVARQMKYSLRDVEILALQNQVIPERYQRNMGTVGIEGQIKLLQSRVAVVGMGGLGGSAFEMLLRWGVGKLVVIDRDVFVDSNLNRQVLSSYSNLGITKTAAAKLRGEQVNPAVQVQLYMEEAGEQNLPEMLQGCEVVVDGLDNIRTRFVLEKVCKGLGIPFIHGAIAGFMGQVASIYPDDLGLEAIYGSREVLESGAEKDLGTPCVTPAAVAAWQVSEVVKILLGWENTLRNKILFFDLKDHLVSIVELS